MREGRKAPEWVRCGSTTIQMVSPGGGDGGTREANFTVGNVYRLEPRQDGLHRNDYFVTDDRGRTAYFPTYLFSEAEAPVPNPGLNLSAIFVEQVRALWGRPEQIADAAISETYRLGDAWGGFDHDDQVRDAKRVALLVGLMASGTPDAFIEAFRHINDNKD